VADFLRALFRAMDEHDVSYCVLHTWKGLPETLSSDLDIAVNLRDREKLRAVFETLRELGFSPLQCQHYAVEGYAFVFAWFRGSDFKSLQLDVVFAYRPCASVQMPGEQLVAGRVRHKGLWIAHPSTAFRYLLIKKTLKGDIRLLQSRQLRELLEEIGRPPAETIASQLFGERWKVLVVDSCSNGTLGALLPWLGASLRRISVASKPIQSTSHFISNSARLISRWFQPTGVCLVVLGPDGVGKTTLTGRLADELRTAFDRQEIFHFRPEFLAPKTGAQTVEVNPHGARSRGTFRSLVHLLGFFADCWLGYLVRIRPAMARSSLIIFDRSFHDLVIDSKRYRYGGPRWLPRLLARFVPPFEPLFLVLDADENAILSRKREIALSKLKRLRSAYVAFASSVSPAALINTDGRAEDSLSASLRAISSYLASRFERRHDGWLASGTTLPSGETKAQGATQF
jgi:thymidylate kinase